MKVSEMVQLCMAGGIIIGICAACYYQNWALVGTIITGAFALLNGNRSTTKGETSEKIPDSTNPTP